MLDPWIIEEILRREEERHQEEGRSRLELPLESPRYRDDDSFRPDNQDGDAGRGVIVLDI